MVCKSDVFVGVNEHNKQWTNWNGDVLFSAEEYWEPAHSAANGPPDGLLSLVHVVARATKEQKHLKAIGSGWAFEDIAKSDAWVVSLSQLTRRLDYVIGPTGGALTDKWRQRQLDATGSRRLVHVEAGIEIGALSAMLAADGLAMRTLGGRNAQSLAGALSTSTHGGDWEEPPLPDFVRAIHLVTNGGQEFWIECASEPITQDDRLQPALPCAGTHILRNDDTFNAALVSCGRFGVIYAFVLEVRTAFRVVEVVTTPARKDLLQALREGIDGGDLYGSLFTLLKAIPAPAGLAETTGVIANRDPSFFQLIFNSQDPDDCWAQRRWETTETEDLPRPDMLVTGELTGTGIFVLAEAALLVAGGAALLIPLVGPVYSTAIAITAAEMGIHSHGRPMTLGDAVDLVLNAMWRLPFVGNAVKKVAHGVLAGEFNQSMTTGKRGPHHILTSGTRAASHNIDYRADSSELIFDATTTAYIDFLDSVLAAAPGFRQCGYISLRPSRSSRATLSMHNFDSQRAVSIEFATMKGLPDNRDWMQYLQREALQRGGRPHWGQVNKLNELEVTALYGKNLIVWREALLRVSGESAIFSNHFTRQRGLEPLNIVRQVTSVRRTPHGVTTHLCGPTGSEWSPISVADAIRQIKAGIARYFTQAGDKVAFLEVVGNEYLRTTPDAAVENNLDYLPEFH
jgi:hypothetical protein